MNPYKTLAITIGTPDALALSHRLASWHDAMVVHQRRAGVVHQRRAGVARRPQCEPDCPHAEAQSLWLEALAIYGERAHALSFLRTHGAIVRGTRRRAAVALHA